MLPTRRRAGARILGGLAFLTTAALTLFCGRAALDRAGMTAPTIKLDVVTDLQEKFALTRSGRADPGAFVVVLLGDSTVLGNPPERQLPARLQEELDRLGEHEPADRVFDIASPALTIFDFYALADEIIDLSPDQALILFNLATFSPIWMRSFARPELTGWIRPARLGEALRLPLHRIDAPANRMLLYMGIVGSGADRLWHEVKREQARVAKARWRSEHRIGARVGSGAETDFSKAAYIRQLEIRFAGNHRRYSRESQRDRHGVALDGAPADHPALRVLEATVRTFSRAGIDTVVFVNAVNVDHMEELGILDPKGLSRTLEAVEAATRSGGGTFVDLHDLVPDRGFHDASGHFALLGGFDAPLVLAEQLAPIVLDESRRRRGALPASESLPEHPADPD